MAAIGIYVAQPFQRILICVIRAAGIIRNGLFIIGFARQLALTVDIAKCVQRPRISPSIAFSQSSTARATSCSTTFPFL